jgi:DNA-binding XRE family transcriptional regulator
MKHKRDSKEFLRVIGDKFHSLRIIQRKDLDTVAKAVKISPALLVRIERGDYDMYLDLLVELCDHYEIAPHDFFRDVDNDLKTLS